MPGGGHLGGNMKELFYFYMRAMNELIESLTPVGRFMLSLAIAYLLTGIIIFIMTEFLLV